jgi:hypothetical protein
MAKVLWDDPDLDGRVVGALKDLGAGNASNAMAPNTVFRHLKTGEVVLGITRVKDSLHRLVEARRVRRTSGSKPRYYLVRK